MANNPKKYASLTSLQNLVDNIKSLFVKKTELNTELAKKADSSHTHSISNVTNLQTTLDSKVPTSRTVNGKALTSNITLSASDVGAASSGHTHDDRYYTETEMDTKLSGKSDKTHNHDSDYADIDHNHDGIYAVEGHNHDTKYDSKGTASSAVSTHNTSTDAHNDIRDLITGLTNRLNTLANSDDTTLDQMSEIVAYIKANKALIDSVTTSKVNVADIVNNLTTNVTNKPLSAAQGVAIKALIDALQSEVDTKVTAVSGKGLSTNDYTTAEKNKLSGIASGAQPNQNAFSNIKVGSTTIAADTTTDTLTFVGTNVTITPDATNDKVTLAVADGTTSAKGVVQLTDSVTSTSTTTAATPKNVKAAYDLANTAKTTADGKANASHTHTVANITDLTATATELNYMDGVTSNVQTQLDELENVKANKIHIHPYGVCSTDGATAAKTVTVSDFALTTGVRVVVKFTTDNTASSPTLNVNGTGAKNIYYNGRKIYARYLAEDKVYEFVYDGSYWVLVGDNITDLMDTSNPTGTGSISINRKAETTTGTKSVAMGSNPTASGHFSVALGEYTTASGDSSFAEGSYTTASGVASHAEGDHTTASADASHAEGNNTEASAFGAHSEGNSTVASGKTAHAEGYITEATGEYSHSEGYYTKASSDYQHVQGSYNIEDENGKYLHIVGNGKDNNGSIIPSNAHTIDWNGNGWFQGDVYVGGESQDDYGVSKLMKETDYEWNLIYNSGSITAKANSISGIDISGYKRIMVAVACVNDGTNISKSGSVIFTGTHGQTYQFPCWTNMFSTSANVTSAGIAQFDIIYGYIVCPTALRSIRTSNFLTAGEGGTADNLTSTGGGIMRCTDDLTTLAVSSLDQDANCNFGVGSRVMVWGSVI